MSQTEPDWHQRTTDMTTAREEQDVARQTYQDGVDAYERGHVLDMAAQQAAGIPGSTWTPPLGPDGERFSQADEQAMRVDMDRIWGNLPTDVQATLLTGLLYPETTAGPSAADLDRARASMAAMVDELVGPRGTRVQIQLSHTGTQIEGAVWATTVYRGEIQAVLLDVETTPGKTRRRRVPWHAIGFVDELCRPEGAVTTLQEITDYVREETPGA